ncbi:MAG TPA: glycosyltransferase [Polyangiaceae bacterium]|nr:glycosyltransferase [Polyangiaceae bacterium]
MDQATNSSFLQTARTHLLTVVVEDYFQATALEGLVPRRHWSRMESRVERSTLDTLALLERHGAKATFFATGSVAERLPGLLREIVERGHEVASKGYEHKPIDTHTPDSFRADVRRSKQAVERAIERRVLGYRVPRGHIGLDQTWALEILAEEGFVYDSSFFPRLRSLARQPLRRFPHEYQTRVGPLMEFPLSSAGSDLLLFPVAGGNYMRQLPPRLMQTSFRWWHNRYTSPFNMYFHVWEMDPELPQIATASFLSRLRQYRNLEQMGDIVEAYLSEYDFTSIADFSRWSQEPLEREPASVRRPAALDVAPRADRTAISIVIPCFNEERSLGFLENTLTEVEQLLGADYTIHYVLVDDCSTDTTWSSMQARFGGRDDCTLVHHEVNQGVAGAILTGIQHASTDIVCSMDADCTYDPLQLKNLIPMLKDDVAMVTASPYHPEGHVVGVPAWRLFLSRNLSRLYGMVLHHRFATYTSCFRVYRKSAVEHLVLSDTGFLGVAEMLILLDLAGERLVECPATLEVRLLGVSKLKTARTIAGHLKLLAKIPELRSHPDWIAERVRGDASHLNGNGNQSGRATP